MATHNAKQVAARARRPTVPADVPILASQITAPGVPDWAVPRPRITKLITQGRRWCRLTVITAPAGAGKTTALVLWAAAAPGTVAWITVDVCDSRPGVFWAHVVAALHRHRLAGELTEIRASDLAFTVAEALAWVHPEHNELGEAHSLTQADTALGVTPDKLIDAVAHLATSTAVTTERSNPCAAGSRTRAHPSCSPMCSTPRPIR
jgi:hypothetical protein